MESVVYEETPLGNYLREEGETDGFEWATAEGELSDLHSHSEGHESDDIRNMPCDTARSSSPPDSPRFAPTGRPQVRQQFRQRKSSQLSLDIPRGNKRSSLSRFKATCESAVSTHINGVDGTKFLEKFRYSIVASQLLSGHSILGQNMPYVPKVDTESQSQETPYYDPIFNSATGPIVGVVAVAFLVPWLASVGYSNFTKVRFLILVVIVTGAGFAAPVYFKGRSIRIRREQALQEITTFVTAAQNLDSASGAAIALIQEVELVSRGYRLSAPLPPVSRIEGKSQVRKCARLRKTMKRAFMEVMEGYIQNSATVKGFAEQLDLEKYYDIYDVSDLDMSDALQGTSGPDVEDDESLRVLKILAARFQTIRKMFLCGLLALEANDDAHDLIRWTTVVECLRTLNETTCSAFNMVSRILSEEESFPIPQTPKVPLTPNRERWRSQLRKLNSLSTGIRGLQAKLALLREESDHSLNESSDISALGPHLLTQYDSIGGDLKELIRTWEEGKAALAQGIDRNEKRLSTMSGMFMLSPTSSLSGPTAVEESSSGDGRLDALRALTGEVSPPTHKTESEVFEALSGPPIRPRSTLTREERIAKMREERDRRDSLRERADANKGMLRELEMVINLRPRSRVSAPPSAGY